jgi:hypothetical protein
MTLQPTSLSMVQLVYPSLDHVLWWYLFLVLRRLIFLSWTDLVYLLLLLSDGVERSLL